MVAQSRCNEKIKWQNNIEFRMGTQSECNEKIIKIIIKS